MSGSKGNSNNNTGSNYISTHNQANRRNGLNFELKLYVGSEGNVSLDLFDMQAENAAKAIVKEYNNKNQIRMFYNQFIIIKEKINDSEENFKKQLPYIKMIKSRARYAKGRKNIKDYFEIFLIKCIDKVTIMEDFYLVCSFFEAVVANVTYYDAKRNSHY